MIESINKTDIIEYWLTLYPEFKKEDDLIKHLEDSFNLSIDDIVSKYLCEIEDIKKETFFSFDDYNNCTFLSFYKKFINDNIMYFLKVVSKSKLLKNKKEFIKDIVTQLCNKLYLICERTLILEMNTCKENGLLECKTADEKLKYFEKHLLDNEQYRENLYSDYPELVKLLNSIANNFFIYVSEIIIHTENNIDAITKMNCTSGSLGKLKSIKIGSGDTHCYGKSVSKLHFEKCIIIYKPRNLTSDIQFQKILNIINENNVLNNVKFKTINMFTTNDMGWMDYIDYAECKNEFEVQEYYFKIGSLLCLLYVFNAVDMHFENIIANGPHPYIIDLESLFHVCLKMKLLDPSSSQNRAIDYIQRSVSSVGLLPSKITIGKSGQKRSISVGGLDLVEGQKNFLKTNFLDKSNLDNIKMNLKEITISEKENVPMFNGKKINSFQYKDNIINGFEETYKWILNNKNDFKNTVLSYFNDTSNRIIIKPTFLYSHLLNISYHPDFLQSSIDRKIILSRIALVLDNNSIVKNEIKALKLGDIPLFKCRFNDKTLVDAYGNFTNVELDETPRQAFINKVDTLSLIDLNIQKEQIFNSFFTKIGESESSINSYTITNKILLKEQLLFTLREIGDYLINNRFTGINLDNNIDCSWIGSKVDKMDNNDWSYQVCDVDLYDGNSGIALFLLYLWKETKNKKYLDVALEAIEPIKLKIKHNIFNKENLSGAFKGASGLFYVLNKFGKVLKDEAYDKFIKNNLSILDRLSEIDNIYDLIGGNVGLIAVLLSIYQNTLDYELKESMLKVCYKCVKRLKENITIENGNDYIINKNALKYSGFSHGTCGLIAYIYKLYTITMDKEIYVFFSKLLKYERETFKSEKMQDWHISTENDDLSYGWCHGSPGILLSRVILKELGYKDEIIDFEVNIALTNILKFGIGNNISYCHGDLGNIDILLYYSKVFNDKKVDEIARDMLNRLYQNTLKDNWNNINKSYSKFKGLLIGISGIGMFLLNKINNELLDHFLWIE